MAITNEQLWDLIDTTNLPREPEFVLKALVQRLRSQSVCTVCGTRSPMRGDAPYPFRPEVGGSFSIYEGSSHSVDISLCPKCCLLVWRALFPRETTNGR